MKKFILSLAMTALTAVMSFAQLTEGHISYDIEMSTDDPEMEMAIALFNGSTMDLYYGDDVARTELDFGSMMSMTTVVDSESDKVLILMGGMMGDKGVLTTSEEMGIEEEEGAEPTITLTKEKKTILGYKCKKAVITDEDGNELEYWYTEKIKPITTDKSAAIAKLPGLALEYVMDRDGMMMSFTATKVETKLDASTKKSKFSFEIPDGYEEMSYEEFSSFGGM